MSTQNELILCVESASFWIFIELFPTSLDLQT